MCKVLKIVCEFTIIRKMILEIIDTKIPETFYKKKCATMWQCGPCWINLEENKAETPEPEHDLSLLIHTTSK